MIVFVSVVFFFGVVIPKYSIASWLVVLYFGYRLRALDGVVLTSSWLDRYAVASKLKVPLTWIITFLTPWNLAFFRLLIYD